MFTDQISFQISDSVVNRLKEEMSAKKNDEQQQRPPPSSSSSTPSPESSPPPPFVPPPPPLPSVPPSSVPVQPHPDVPFVHPESSLSALRVRAEKEEELRFVENYWQQRVRDIRNHVRERETKRALNGLRKASPFFLAFEDRSDQRGQLPRDCFCSGQDVPQEPQPSNLPGTKTRCYTVLQKEPETVTALRGGGRKLRKMRGVGQIGEIIYLRVGAIRF